MKTIQAVSIWDKGQSKQATILYAYAVNVTLNKCANFWYGLFETKTDGNLGTKLTEGNILMKDEDYALWQEDGAAWDFIASQLNLTITGDYVAPVIEESAEQPAEEITTQEETPVE